VRLTGWSIQSITAAGIATVNGGTAGTSILVASVDLAVTITKGVVWSEGALRRSAPTSVSDV